MLHTSNFNIPWIWSNYNDLTRPGPPKGSLVGEVPKRFVNYYNLPRWMAILEPSLWRDLSTGQCCSWILSKSVATNEPIPVESSTPKGERWGNQILYFCMVGDLSPLWMDVVGVLNFKRWLHHISPIFEHFLTMMHRVCCFCMSLHVHFWSLNDFEP